MFPKLALQPIDKIAIFLIFILSMAIAALVWSSRDCDGNCLFHTGAKVTSFSWQQQTIGRENKAFVLTFNRPMARYTVEENLTIEPPLPGKISWSGRRLAYTLAAPAPYGEQYRVSLANAREQFAGGQKLGSEIQPFVGEFRSRDRALVYIGSQGEANGRLVVYNWTKKQKKILTPPELIVFEVKSYPQGDLLLFSAAERTSGNDAIRNLKLYTVTTGLNSNNQENFSPDIKLVVDNQDYQNNKFDLSSDGKTIVVQRINRHNSADFGLWSITENQSPQLLNDAPVGDFIITPDSQAVAVAQGEGIALLPLEAKNSPLEFLPKFGRVLSFTANGTGAAMINYNTDNAELRYTRSLYYINNQGVERELLNLEGSIIDCQFDPLAINLYCLLTELQITNSEYQEKPYLAEINLQTAATKPLIALPEYQDTRLSMAPDGLGILFDQRLTTKSTENNSNFSEDNQDNIVNSRLWMLIPPAEKNSDSTLHRIEKLPFMGYSPQWLP